MSLFCGFSNSFHHKAAIPKTVKLPKPLREYFRSNLSQDDVEKEIEHLKIIKLSKEPVEYIENSTKAQGNSLLWKEVRIGRITASIGHDVLHTNIDSPSITVIKKICMISQPINTDAIKWG